MYFSKNDLAAICLYVSAQLNLDEKANIKLLFHSCDSLAVCVNDNLILKFPRDAEAEDKLRVECAALLLLFNRVEMPIPQMVLHEGEYIFTSHKMLAGEHLTTQQYDRLLEPAKDELAQTMATFFVQLHGIDLIEIEQIGIGKINSYLSPGEIIARTKNILSSSLHPFLFETMEQYSQIRINPREEVFGYFDGHGENMAFDHQAQRLNGVFDFADCGIADFHQELHCPNWVSRDLTARIINKYELLTGRVVDRKRVDYILQFAGYLTWRKW